MFEKQEKKKCYQNALKSKTEPFITVCTRTACITYLNNSTGLHKAQSHATVFFFVISSERTIYQRTEEPYWKILNSTKKR